MLTIAALWAVQAMGAQAAVSISTKPTQNMTCTGGVCSPTAKKAVLNITDLAGMLASGDVKVTSDSVAQDVEVDDTLSWTSAHRLTLDSYHSITFNQMVVVAGTGGLTIATNDGGSDGDFRFLKRGSVKFWDARSSLVINGQSYRLMESLRAFAKELRRDDGSGEYFAQMKNWREAQKTYVAPPINLEFNGTFEGLGNSISHLTINNPTIGVNAGLFAALGLSSTVRDLQLTSVDIVGSATSQFIGALAGGSGGLVENVQVTGRIVGGAESLAGGLLGSDFGTLIACSSSATVQAGDGTVAGGLVGRKGVQLGGDISASYATGSVSGGGAAIGGLIGEAMQGGTISDSFATGSVTGSGAAPAGGLIGVRTSGGGSSPKIVTSYSTGFVASGTGAPIGGSIGEDDVAGSGIGNDYWDLDTSGVSDPAQGAGNVQNDPGITGLTDAQLKSGLPQGFDPSIWTQKATVNNGYPYLIANPPQ